jgi:hypothetical protein
MREPGFVIDYDSGYSVLEEHEGAIGEQAALGKMAADV